MAEPTHGTSTFADLLKMLAQPKLTTKRENGGTTHPPKQLAVPHEALGGCSPVCSGPPAPGLFGLVRVPEGSEKLRAALAAASIHAISCVPVKR